MNTDVMLSIPWNDDDAVAVHFLADDKGAKAYFPDRKDFKLTTEKGRELTADETQEVIRIVSPFTVRVPRFLPSVSDYNAPELREIIRRCRERLRVMNETDDYTVDLL